MAESEESKLREWRCASKQRVTDLGLPFNERLPLLEDIHTSKSSQVCAERALSLYAFMHVVFGEATREELSTWLNFYDLRSSLASSEHSYLNGKTGSDFEREKIESLYSLAWALSLVQSMDEKDYVPDSLAGNFPNLYAEESAVTFYRRTRLRPVAELGSELDFMYCYHWALVDNRINHVRTVGALSEPAIRSRRHSLEWILSDDSWDQISLDT